MPAITKDNKADTKAKTLTTVTETVKKSVDALRTTARQMDGSRIPNLAMALQPWLELQTKVDKAAENNKSVAISLTLRDVKQALFDIAGYTPKGEDGTDQREPSFEKACERAVKAALLIYNTSHGDTKDRARGYMVEAGQIMAPCNIVQPEVKLPGLKGKTIKNPDKTPVAVPFRVLEQHFSEAFPVAGRATRTPAVKGKAGQIGALADASVLQVANELIGRLSMWQANPATMSKEFTATHADALAALHLEIENVMYANSKVSGWERDAKLTA